MFERILMPNSYTQIYIHIVIVVKFRDALLRTPFRIKLQKYITGIIQNRGHKLIVINGMPDHVHILIGYNPAQGLADLVRDIKSNSTKMINEERWFKVKFQWQGGYGAFSYSKSEIGRVIKYIEKQQEHHSVKSFKKEYLEFLEEYDIEYEEKYLFNFKLEDN